MAPYRVQVKAAPVRYCDLCGSDWESDSDRSEADDDSKILPPEMSSKNVFQSKNCTNRSKRESNVYCTSECASPTSATPALKKSSLSKRKMNSCDSKEIKEGNEEASAKLNSFQKKYEMLDKEDTCDKYQTLCRLLTGMKPVPIPIKRELYKGLSHEDKGRAKYLKNRSVYRPEDRWYFPVCSSMEYGWTWNRPPEIKNPEYGKYMTIKRTFFRSNDTQLKPRDGGFW